MHFHKYLSIVKRLLQHWMVEINSSISLHFSFRDKFVVRKFCAEEVLNYACGFEVWFIAFILRYGTLMTNHWWTILYYSIAERQCLDIKALFCIERVPVYDVFAISFPIDVSRILWCLSKGLFIVMVTAGCGSGVVVNRRSSHTLLFVCCTTLPVGRLWFWIKAVLQKRQIHL